MTIQYRIYVNDGAGGPVDYATPIGTTAGLTFAPAPLAVSSDTTFAVRAYDTVSGLEERNVDARARIVLDGAGVDITARPEPPTGLTATPILGGALAAWQHARSGTGAAPTTFRVYVGSPTPNYATPVATVPYARGRLAFQSRVTGLSAGTYQVAVRSYNPTGGEESNAVVAEFVVPAAGPDPVDGLAAVAIT